MLMDGDLDVNLYSFPKIRDRFLAFAFIIAFSNFSFSPYRINAALTHQNIFDSSPAIIQYNFYKNLIFEPNLLQK